MIWFNQNKEAYAVPDGQEIPSNAIATVADEVWNRYCIGVRGRDWDIIDGVFSPLQPPETVNGRAEAEARISELRRLLTDSDYIVIKVQEASLMGRSEEVESIKQTYSEELADRVRWREEINELQSRYGL